MQLLRQFNAYKFDQYLWLNIIDNSDEDEDDDFCRFRQLWFALLVFVDFTIDAFVDCIIIQCLLFFFTVILFWPMTLYLHLFCGNSSALNFTGD